MHTDYRQPLKTFPEKGISTVIALHFYATA